MRNMMRPHTRTWWPCAWFSVGVGLYPQWQRGGFCFRENGGRYADECLDMTIDVWKVTCTCTMWGLGRLSVLTRYLPRPRRGGYRIGWLPVGAAE